ncbi:MAG: lysophospholipid acyltransferase family protein [Planctomycetota bacterium]
MAGKHPRETPRDPIARRNAWLNEKFLRYSQRLVRRRFHAVRMLEPGEGLSIEDARPSQPPTSTDSDVPSVHTAVYLNHPSWWDPMAAVVVARAMFRDQQHYAPIDADMLAAYPLLDRFGFFGVDRGSPRGAAAFFRTSSRILEDPGRMLWLTAQGRFADVRDRPVGLMPGLAHLARRLPGLQARPLAVEYGFWEQSKPEMFLSLGDPVGPPPDPSSTEAWSVALEAAITQQMDALSDAVRSRDPDRFTTLNAGRSGVGGAYDLGRRFVAWARGKRFTPDHGRS